MEIVELDIDENSATAARRGVRSISTVNVCQGEPRGPLRLAEAPGGQ